MKEMISDYDLINGFINGEDSCFEQLVLRHKDKVYSYISLYIHEQVLVEDIFQDTFLKVLQSIRSKKYTENGKFISWVLRIAHNLIIDHYRQAKQLKFVSKDDYENDILNSKKLVEENIEDSMIRKQIHKDIRKVINELPPEQKEVVILRHFAELSFKEISDITGVSINTALGRMRYALINMRKIMEAKNIVISYE